VVNNFPPPPAAVVVLEAVEALEALGDHLGELPGERRARDAGAVHRAPCDDRREEPRHRLLDAAVRVAGEVAEGAADDLGVRMRGSHLEGGASRDRLRR
jgi:hypothetical protein